MRACVRVCVHACIQNAGRIGGFGLGFKTGSLAVGHTAVVFSGNTRPENEEGGATITTAPKGIFTIGVISIKPTLDDNQRPYARMIGSFDASRAKNADG